MRQAGIAVETLEMQRGWLAGARRLWRLTRELRPDVVQGWMYHGSLMATVARRAHPRAALAWNLRGSDLDWSATSLATRGVVMALAAASRAPGLIIANSEAGRRFHRGLGYAGPDERWRMIPNGFDLAQLRPDPAARASVRAELGIDEGRPLIGMLARSRVG